MKTNLVKTLTMGAIVGAAMLPVAAMAQRCDHDRTNWNNIAIGSAAVGVLGLLGHNSTVATIGLLGAGYSAVRASDGGPRDRFYVSGPVYRHDYRVYEPVRYRHVEVVRGRRHGW